MARVSPTPTLPMPPATAPTVAIAKRRPVWVDMVATLATAGAIGLLFVRLCSAEDAIARLSANIERVVKPPVPYPHPAPQRKKRCAASTPMRVAEGDESDESDESDDESAEVQAGEGAKKKGGESAEVDGVHAQVGEPPADDSDDEAPPASDSTQRTLL